MTIAATMWMPSIVPWPTSITITASTSTLSAIGSRKVPKRLIWLRLRAIRPSTKSVSAAAT